MNLRNYDSFLKKLSSINFFFYFQEKQLLSLTAAQIFKL